MVSFEEDDRMGYHRLSRRQLLRGLLAGLWGWLCAARPAAARAQARPRPHTLPCTAGRPTFSITVYDSLGRCIAVDDGPPDAVEPCSGTADTLRRVSTFTSGP